MALRDELHERLRGVRQVSPDELLSALERVPNHAMCNWLYLSWIFRLGLEPTPKKGTPPMQE